MLVATVLTAVTVGLAGCSAAPDDARRADNQGSTGATTGAAEESAGVQTHGSVPGALDGERNLGIPVSAPLAGPQPGESKTINLSSGRSFILHVPADYDENKRWPVVMAFHGWKESADTIHFYSQFTEAHAITIFPQGKARAWAPAPYAKTSGEEDVQFVRDIVDAIRATYSVDDNRIYAAGMSNGGGFAAYLACQIPDVVSSVATISAAYYESIHSDCAGLPVGRLDLHGTMDPVVKYYGGKRHGKRYVGVPEVLAMDAARNRCDEATSTERLGRSALFQTWTYCEAPLQHIRIGGGRHEWPGRVGATSREVPLGFATDKILDFFAIPGRAEGAVN